MITARLALRASRLRVGKLRRASVARPATASRTRHVAKGSARGAADSARSAAAVKSAQAASGALDDDAQLAVGGKLTDQAYAKIEELIVTLQLAPGQAVSEFQLARRLVIGRTPVREALQRLARERLVLILPRRGIVVAGINVGDQLRLLEVRREVERLVARSAARRANAPQRAQFTQLAQTFQACADHNDDVAFMRADRQFNDLCLSAARNDFASGAMSLMNGLSRRFWYVHYKEAANLPETAQLHARIAIAIADGDADRAAQALDSLLDNIERFTRATLDLDL